MLRRKESTSLSARQIALLQTFADQAVIAISERTIVRTGAGTNPRSCRNRSTNCAPRRIAWCRPKSWLGFGQLTAGIAHEIKNPLNFINNFSALTADLIGELDEALAPVALAPETRDWTSAN